MKRLEELSRKWSVKFFFSEQIPIELTDEFQKEIELYAREVAKASLEKAAENVALFNEFSEFEFKHWIDKKSITNPNNITLL